MPLFTDPAVLLHPGYAASRYYPTFNGPFLNNSAVGATNTIYFYPFILPRALTFTAGRVRIQTGQAGSSMKSGIWANSPTSFRPLGAPVVADNTGIATTSSTTDAAITMSGTLQAGETYWFGSKFTGTLPTMWSVVSQNAAPTWLAGIPSGSALNTVCFSYADTYSNNMPTIAEGASFTAVSANVPPHLWLAT